MQIKFNLYCIWVQQGNIASVHKYEREVLAVKADLEFTVTEYDLWVIFRERKKGLTTTMLG